MLTPALRSKVDTLWDRFWSGGIANPLSAIEQISYLLFMRRLDALDEKKRGDAEFTRQAFTSLFAGKYETRGGKKRSREELRWRHEGSRCRARSARPLATWRAARSRLMRLGCGQPR